MEFGYSSLYSTTIAVPESNHSASDLSYGAFDSPPPFDLDFSSCDEAQASPATSYIPTPGHSPILLPLDLNDQYPQQSKIQEHYSASLPRKAALEAYQVPIAHESHQQLHQHPYQLYQYSAGASDLSQLDLFSASTASQHSSQYAPFGATAEEKPHQGQSYSQMPLAAYPTSYQALPPALPQPAYFGYASAPPPPALATSTAPLSSFETPQGTFYFVPNPASQQPQFPWAAPVVPVVSPSPVPEAPKQTPTPAELLAMAGLTVTGEVKPKPGGLPGGKQGKKSTRKNAGKGQVKRFICPHPECGRGFARNFNMQSHLKSHLGIRDFNCPHCPKMFSRRHDRARHCAAVHDDLPRHSDDADEDEED